MQNAFDTYEKSYGPYEWEKVGYSFVPFTNGAMEHASNITFPKSFTNGSTTYEDFMAHELSHHWWGDLVTCKTEGDMWINEGMASYSENLFFENVYGYANYITKIKANQTKILHFAHHKEGGYRAISGIPELYTYGDHVYLKGKSVAHNLRSYLGDSLFFVGLKSFISTHKFTSVTSYDFRDALESATGYDLHPFFNDWVFSAGYPHFSIDSTVITNVASQNLTTVYIKQKLTGAPNYYTQVPLEITFMDSLWNKQTASIYMSGKNASFTFTLPFKPKYAALNLNQKINDAISSEAQTIKTFGAHNFPNALMNVTVKSISDSVFLRVEHNWTSPDALKDSSKNYILSPNRYWKIDGLINSDFKATAKITYDGRTSSFSGTSYLDNELITATEDSLVLLYRSNASADWNPFPYYTKAMGNVNDKTGSITIDSLFLGEYTLAMKTAAPTTIKVIYESSKGFRIYPNPAGDKLNIEFNGSNYNNSDININDSNLKLINSFHLEGNESVFSTSTRDWPNGIYFVVVTQRTTQQTIMQKVIIRHGR